FSATPVNFTINKRPITITPDANQSKIYGNSDPTLTGTITTGTVTFGDTPTGALSRIAGENSGTYAITLGTYSYGNNYTLTLSSTTVNFTITKRDITVTPDAGQSKIYGDSDPIITSTVTTGSVIPGDTPTGLLVYSGTGAGAYPITIGTLTYGNNYQVTLNPTPVLFTINKRPITITPVANQSKIYGNSDPILTASVTAGSIVGGDTPTGALSRAAGENVGTYLISEGTYTYGNNYDATFSATTVNFTINKKPITITPVANQSKIYGDSDPTLTASVTTGSVVGNDTFTGTLSRAAGENVGTYLISAGTYSYGNNYDLTFSATPVNFTINKRPITITVDANQSKVYGSADPLLSYRITSGNLIGSDVLSQSLARTGSENVGTYSITQGTLTAGPNYQLTFIGASFSITARPISITANDASKIYGGTDPTSLTYSITSGSVVGTDNLGITLVRVSGENAGNYDINKSNVATNSNYTITFIKGIFTIQPTILTVNINNTTRAYGYPDPVFTASYSGFVLGDTESVLDTKPVFVSDALPTSAAGTTHAIDGINGSDLNYILFYVPGVLTITQAELIATPDARARVYGEPNPTFTITYTGLRNGETQAVLDSKPTVTTTATVSSPIGEYPLVASEGQDDNYFFTYVEGKLTIGKATLTIAVNPVTRFYGDPNPVLTATYTGLVNNETAADLDVQPTITTTATLISGVGTYPITISGASDPSYNINMVGAVLTVEKAILNINVQNVTRLYGADNPTFNITYSGFKNNETIAVITKSITATCTAISTSDAGTYPIVLSGGEAANYSFNYNNGVLTITSAPQTISFQALNDVDISTGNITLSGSASSGLPLIYQSNDVSKVEINGSQVTLKLPGIVTITATQPGNVSYLVAAEVSQTFCILPSRPSITSASSTSFLLQSSSAIGNQWYRNKGPILGATEATFTFDAEGIYNVRVGVEGCMSEFSNDYSVIITSADLEPPHLLGLAPNPTTSLLRIHGLNPSQPQVQFMITDAVGRSLPVEVQSRTGGTAELTVEHLVPGMYLLLVHHDQQSRVLRFIKE
ncbi:MAG: MBG domain-containing protein, partial [Cyclobacteriaceae bacterium]